jgi:hypothetical protein
MNNGESTGNDAEVPPRQRTRYHDDSTYATDPVPVVVDDRRLRLFCPQLFGWSGRKAENKRLRGIISEHMRFGDSRAAVVVSSNPLLVAAYTDELDCVSILRFAPGMPIPELPIGWRLLTVNTYKRGKDLDADLFPGPLQIPRWVGFYPIIADFICGNQDVVDRRKDEIDEREWERTLRFGSEYLSTHPGLNRDGSPCKSAMPPKVNIVP